MNKIIFFIVFFSIIASAKIPNTPEITGEFGKLFPASEIEVAIIGGSTKTGLGQINNKDLIGKFFLINNADDEGIIDRKLDWNEDIPDDLQDKFEVVFLEQIYAENLVKLLPFINAFKALKPGGILIFNTYDLMSYASLVHNLKICKKKYYPDSCPVQPGTFEFEQLEQLNNHKSLENFFKERLFRYGFRPLHIQISDRQIDVGNLLKVRLPDVRGLRCKASICQFFNMPIIKENINLPIIIEYSIFLDRRIKNKSIVEYNSGGIIIAQKPPFTSMEEEEIQTESQKWYLSNTNAIDWCKTLDGFNKFRSPEGLKKLGLSEPEGMNCSDWKYIPVKLRELIIDKVEKDEKQRGVLKELYLNNPPFTAN